ncbi:MAG: hypothetical protein ACREJM_14385, partial [Candidatus Saccharimonadales bacterium]
PTASLPVPSKENVMSSLTKTLSPVPSAQPRLGPSNNESTGGTLVRGLGWFSIGLGVAEVLAPAAMGRLTGVRNKRLVQLYGLREIAAGVGLFSSARPAGWLWARVVGDALDIAALSKAASDGKEHRGRSLFSAAAVAGVTAIDVLCAMHARRAK